MYSVGKMSDSMSLFRDIGDQTGWKGWRNREGGVGQSLAGRMHGWFVGARGRCWLRVPVDAGAGSGAAARGREGRLVRKFGFKTPDGACDPVPLLRERGAWMRRFPRGCLSLRGACCSCCPHDGSCGARGTGERVFFPPSWLISPLMEASDLLRSGGVRRGCARSRGEDLRCTKPCSVRGRARDKQTPLDSAPAQRCLAGAGMAAGDAAALVRAGGAGSAPPQPRPRSGGRCRARPLVPVVLPCLSKGKGPGLGSGLMVETRACLFSRLSNGQGLCCACPAPGSTADHCREPDLALSWEYWSGNAWCRRLASHGEPCWEHRWAHCNGFLFGAAVICVHSEVSIVVFGTSGTIEGRWTLEEPGWWR